MYQIKLIFLSTILTLNDSFEDTNLIKFTTEIIKLSFRDKRCIYYLGNGNPIIENALQSINIAIVRIDSTNNMETCTPNGYIISQNNFTTLSQIFTPFNFWPHKRILVFYEGEENLIRRPLTTSARFLGADILIFGKNNDEITLSLVYTNKTLINWKINEGNYTINVQDFKEFDWKPHGDEIVRLSTFPCEPFIYYSEFEGMYDGLEKHILDYVMKDWNVMFLQRPESYWDLSLDEIKNDSCEFGTGGQWHLSVIAEGLDMTYPYAQSCATFLVPKPHPLPETTFVFQPMKLQTWLVLFFFITGISGIIFATNKTKKFYNIFLNILSITVLNSIGKIPINNNRMSKLILFAWSVTSLLLCTSYSAGFTSSLTAPRFSYAIQTVEDMLVNGVYCYESDTTATELLSNSANKFQREMSKRITHTKAGLPPDTCYIVDSLPEKFVIPETTLSNYSRTHLKMLAECMGQYYFVFPLRKKSPLKKIFDKYIIKFSENGLINAWINSIKYKHYEELKYVNNFYIIYTSQGAKRMNLFKLQGAFGLLFLGYLISCFVFLTELLYK